MVYLHTSHHILSCDSQLILFFGSVVSSPSIQPTNSSNISQNWTCITKTSFFCLPGTRGWYFVQNLLPDLFFPSFQKTSSSNQDLFVLIYSLEGKSGRIAGAHFSEYKTSNLKKKGWTWKQVLPIRIFLPFSILKKVRVGASGRTQDHSLGLVIHLAREKLGH